MFVDAQPQLVRVDRRPEAVRCPGEPITGLRRILVIRDDRLGDVVLTLPAIRALRRTYPRAWLGLLVRRSVAAFASMAADVDELIVRDDDDARLDARIEEFRPDATVCVSRTYRAARAIHRLGLPNRVGTGRRPYSWMFHRRVEEPRRGGGLHEVEYALSFAHRLGAEPGPAEFPLHVPEGVTDSCTHWLEMHGVSHPYVVLHPGSGGSCPAWPIEHHVQLAAVLAGQGIPVVFSVGPADEEVHETLDREARAIRKLPRLSGSAQGLAGLLDQAAVVVASSTGPAHLSAALGTPTLAFHAPWRSCCAERWGPYAPNGWALVADLDGARRWTRRRRRRDGVRLLETLSPSIAVQVVADLLAGRTPTVANGGGDDGSADAVSRSTPGTDHDEPRGGRAPDPR